MGFKNEKEMEDFWTGVAKEQLLGKKVVMVRYMSKEEAKGLGWYHRPVVIQLDDGNVIYPSHDDEGNDAGAMFTNNDDQPVLPVL